MIRVQASTLWVYLLSGNIWISDSFFLLIIVKEVHYLEIEASFSLCVQMLALCVPLVPFS